MTAHRLAKDSIGREDGASHSDDDSGHDDSGDSSDGRDAQAGTDSGPAVVMVGGLFMALIAAGWSAAVLDFELFIAGGSSAMLLTDRICGQLSASGFTRVRNFRVDGDVIRGVWEKSRVSVTVTATCAVGSSCTALATRYQNTFLFGEGHIYCTCSPDAVE